MVTAAAQTQGNIDTAKVQAGLNRVNQYGPQGSVTYSVDPSGITWNQYTNLSPEQQNLYNQQVRGQQMYGDAALQQLGNLQGILSRPVDFSGAPAAGTAYQPGGQIAPTATYQHISPTIDQSMYSGLNSNIGYGEQARNEAEQALLGRLQPVQDRQRDQLTTQLRNQGLVPGSEAWTNAMSDLGRQENDARLAAIAQAGQEELNQANIANMAFGQQLQGRQLSLQGADALFGQQAANRSALADYQNSLFGQQLQGRQLFGQEQNQAFNQQNALRQQAIQEMLTQRQVPLNEIAALLGGQQVQYPVFGNVAQTNVGQTDYIGAQQNSTMAQNNAYNARVANANSGNATAGTIGASAITAAAAII